MRYLFVTTKKSARERFAVKPTTNQKRLNIWHDNGKNIYLYTITQNDKYNQHMVWSERKCRELLEELQQSEPTVQVVRFAVDGVLYIADPESTPEVPAMPEKTAAQIEYQKKWTVAFAELEAKKGAEPAPFVLFGKHLDGKKEYSWKLTPDSPARQGIKPGDQVEVWTDYGYKKIVVTRIEKFEEAGIEPKGRVKKKVFQD